MKYMIRFYTLFLMTVFVMDSSAGVNINVNIGGQQSDYYRSVADYHGVSEQDVYFLRNRGISDDRMPVIFQIASLANVAPSVVASRYGTGISLLDLTRIFGLTPEVYYVPVKVKVDGPPYGKAYGYYRNRARKEWKYIYLSDDDIINFSNLKFMSNYYNVDPDIIINKRSKGLNFVVINEDLDKQKKSKDHKHEREFNNKMKRGKQNQVEGMDGNKTNEGNYNDKGKKDNIKSKGNKSKK